MKIAGKPYVILISLTAGLGGFLFGFDTAVISGAINLLRSQFHLNAVMEGWLMSSALIGCVIGAAVSGWLADRYGRKKILSLSALLFIVSAAGCALAVNPSELVVARMVGGVGVGFAAMVAPMFISELSPANMRGRLVSLYQLAITLGILCSYLSNAALLHYAGFHSAGDGSLLNYYLVAEIWRGMLGSNMIPALLFFILLFLVPESPRWLMKENKTVDAGAILARINGAGEGLKEIENIRKDLLEEKGSFRQLLEPGIRVALIIGLVLPFLSQLTGITTVMYYAPAIFEKAGLGANSAMGSASVIGFFNMIFTLVAIWKIDRWGRKPLLIWGFAGLSLALFLIGFLFNRDTGASGFLLGAFVFYIALFASTLGPGVWVVLSEIYPTKIRGRAMSLGTLSLFVGSSFVTQTYPVLRESAGIGNTFILYGLLMVPAAFFVKKVLPETRGKTLEEIGRFWKTKKENRQAVRPVKEY
jgi:sugar porter (SP) family MFS transporter